MVDLAKRYKGLNIKGNAPLVVVGKLAGLSSNPLEQIVDKGVHDAHGLGRDASVGMNLLKHLQKPK